MPRKRNLEHQFKYILSKSHHRGGSKRAAKFDGQMDHLVFGDMHYDALCQHAKMISNFMEKRGIRMLYDIKYSDIKDYLDQRAKTCNATTMVKEISYVRKLEEIAQHYYPRSSINWGTNDFKASDYASASKPPEYEKNKTMDLSTVEELIDNIRTYSKTNAWKALAAGRCLGFRISEIVKIKIQNFSFNPDSADPNNLYGFGYYIINKNEGAKGNRPRIIPIHSAEDRDYLMSLCGDRRNGYLITNYRSAARLTSSAVNKQIVEAMKRLNIYDQFRGNIEHAVRKLFAQTVYDLERNAGRTQHDALVIDDCQLGHGDKRGKRLHDTYVHNQW